ncbi:pyruvate, phosphate dikinase [Ornithinicoccus hortensis]|uniref:Pyruvate,orthophosphate dikinase n=1 Tax=Ornithinicoccus hortensis TaxID=82346 RepID=A0A542YTC2_9MICO|nr:pyruvate, phosphate dikinase [Ornithinicoccus hortensis]TQL51343.1 pyruvate,orthophosphate dikinase [Ornithinicoccus hortensis]
MTAYIRTFADGDPDDVALLGGKGAGLVSMIQNGLPVPPGFVITTEASREFLRTGTVPPECLEQARTALAELEETTGKVFGAGPTPLLLSVRSGAPISMPGMMDTILNLGLTRTAAQALGEVTGSTRFVADVTRRFHEMYADTVLGALEPSEEVAEALDALDPSVDPGEAYDRIWGLCATALEDELAEEVPTDAVAQLEGAIGAVIRSWNTRRARTYREFHHISHDLGTAVVVQAMVFGNLGQDSGSGVAFTRNPVSGEPELYGEFLTASQGEDVVSGAYTPSRIQDIEHQLPAPFADLRRYCAELERQRTDVLDIEFTIERSTLYFLQVRSAKRTPEAAVRIALDFLAEGQPPTRALQGLTAAQVRQVARPRFAEDDVRAARDEGRLVTTGVGASPGQVSGSLVFEAADAQRLAEDEQPVILARPITSPADLHGMIAARGIVTGKGGATSHAAVVARALGTACVVGCADARIDPGAGTLTVGETVLRSGDEVSLDGSSGELFAGRLGAGTEGSHLEQVDDLLARCREMAGCEVYARVTLPSHVEQARRTGATGLVTAIDDVLAATGHLDDLVSALMSRRTIGADTARQLEDAVATALAPVLAEAGEQDVNVRALDFIADESREFLQQTPLLTVHPALSLPLGVPELIRAQLAGLARAAAEAGRTLPPVLAVRHVSDEREARALTELAAGIKDGRSVRVGSYATSGRGLAHVGKLTASTDVYWVELKLLLAAYVGLPARLFNAAKPLDEYVQAGHLGLDPRVEIEGPMRQALETVVGACAAGTRPGVRLSMPVTDDLVDSLYRLGFRRFAVDIDELRPLTFALGKAAAQPA